MNGRKTQYSAASPGKSRGKTRFRRLLLALAVLVALPVLPHLFALRLPPPPGGKTDAVVVLSGGAGRIAEGFDAWQRGAGRELCILGAGRQLRPLQLLPKAAGLTQGELSRIRVEGWSENTLENAFSAKTIAEERKYASVILVTSDYHVPRAYHVFRRILPPETAIYVIRVGAESGSPSGVAWRWLRRHFLEGWKYWGYRVLLRWE